MTDNPFLTAPAAVYVVRHVRVTPAGEVVAEVGNALPRYAGFLASFLTPEAVAIEAAITLPSWSNEDYAQAFLQLLPLGRAWPKFPTSNLYQAILPLVGTYARDVPSQVGSAASANGSSPRATNLLLDTMPFWNVLGANAVTELLPEWQATLGLPDECLGANPSLDQQVKQAVSRFIGIGGQSIPFYTSFALSLGFTIEITEFAPFRADISDADTLLYDESEFFVWQVESADSGGWLFEADLNTADEALGFFANTVLECEVRRIAPAHTFVFFTYSTEIDTTANMPSAVAVTGAGVITPLADVLKTLTGAKGTSAAGTVHHSP